MSQIYIDLKKIKMETFIEEDATKGYYILRCHKLLNDGEFSGEIQVHVCHLFILFCNR